MQSPESMLAQPQKLPSQLQDGFSCRLPPCAFSRGTPFPQPPVMNSELWGKWPASFLEPSGDTLHGFFRCGTGCRCWRGRNSGSPKSHKHSVIGWKRFYRPCETLLMGWPNPLWWWRAFNIVFDLQVQLVSFSSPPSVSQMLGFQCLPSYPTSS